MNPELTPQSTKQGTCRCILLYHILIKRKHTTEDPHASQNTKEKERKTTWAIFEYFTSTSGMYVKAQGIKSCSELLAACCATCAWGTSKEQLFPSTVQSLLSMSDMFLENLEQNEVTANEESKVTPLCFLPLGHIPNPFSKAHGRASE